MGARTRMPRIPEKVVQTQIAATLRTVGGRVYTIGTRRPRGDYQGTCQTPGIPDLLAFLPERRPGVTGPLRLLFIEAKTTGGRLSDEQRAFRQYALDAGVAHVTGHLDAVIAWLIEAGLLKRENVPHYRLPAAEART